MKVEHSVEIQRPVTQVFALVSDLEQQPRWMDLLDRVRIEEGSPAGVGQRFVQHFHEGERAAEARGEVTVFDPGRELVLAVVGDGFRARVQYRFEDLGSRTRLTQTSTVQFSGLLPRLLQPLIRRRSRQQLARYYASLARLLEAAHDDPEAP